ncbi:AAA family ATPase [Candidatus Woesearchaeota archaeon]|nr:MAG: AAA family ATPase [Candidatus Woesearchaeota archaeon]
MSVSNEISRSLMEKENPFDEIIGQEEAKKQLSSALLSGRHVLIIGQPGIGKTTLAKNVAKILPSKTVNDCGFNCLPKKPVCPACRSSRQKTKKVSGKERFIRIQGSPDLTSEDLIGDIDPIKALKYGPLSTEAFTPGKIFKANNGVLFFDELNRCPERLQNTLLQILEEGKATIGSYDLDFEADFVFIGTLNPKDINTEKLSDGLLDRFDIINMDFPESDEVEKHIVKVKGKNLGVEFPEILLSIAVRFVRGLRESDDLEKLPSVRASLGLYERAQANAIIANRKNVSFDDIKDAVLSVLSHRIELKPSIKYLKSPSEFLNEEFRKFAEENRETIEKGGYL